MGGRPHYKPWWLSVLLLVALACNFPTAETSPAGPLSGEQLRQTLSAPLITFTPGAGEPTGEPPGEPPGEPSVQSPQPSPPSTSQPAWTPQPVPEGAYAYQSRSGDTLDALASRFGVEPGQIVTPPDVLRGGLLPPGTALTIPNVLGEVTPAGLLLPDSELVYSPSAADFDLTGFVSQAGGYLSSYRELVNGEDLSGAAIVGRVADDLSVNPRLLLAILEFRSGWVFGAPRNPNDLAHPIGLYVPNRTGLYQEIQITATQLNVAYYGWRQGTFTEIKYRRETLARLNPTLNAGTVALQHFFAMLYRPDDWLQNLYGSRDFPLLYTDRFGDPWQRAAAVEPLFPQGLAGPPLELPFLPGERWSLTAGPHQSWNAGTPRGALDFSPVTGEAVCAVSRVWATAVAAGVIARAGHNTVALDLDGDGFEGTGWVLVYLHLAEKDLVAEGGRVELDAPLGHPSCEGGRATGKHVHLARKYNGEWLPADGAIPFVLSGWLAQADARNYYGTMVKGDEIVGTSPGGARTSIIIR